MSEKKRLLKWFDQAREEMRSALEGIDTEQEIYPGWGMRENIAHITGWRARSLRRLEAAANGQPEPKPVWPATLSNDDEINDWIYEQNRERLLGEVVSESRESFARLGEIVQMLPDEALSDPAYFPWLEGQALGPAIVDGAFFGHWHEEHESEVRRWLKDSA